MVRQVRDRTGLHGRLLEGNGKLTPQPRDHAMVGILNSAPARMPVGQRVVTAFCLV
jgi:hypothetical protein